MSSPKKLLIKASELSQKELLKLIGEYDEVYYNNSKTIKPISDKKNVGV